jgi:hypothetical protein
MALDTKMKKRDETRQCRKISGVIKRAKHGRNGKGARLQRPQRENPETSATGSTRSDTGIRLAAKAE